MKNSIKKAYAYNIVLHYDSRPKDKYYAWHFRTKTALFSYPVVGIILGLLLIIGAMNLGD